MPLSRSRTHRFTPALAAVLALSATFAQAQPAGGYNPNDVLDLYKQDGFGAQGRESIGPAIAIPVKLPTNVDLAAIRRGLDSAAIDARALYDSLNSQSTYVPAARQYIADVLQMQARAQMLSRQIATKTDLERAVPELRVLDSDWRRVSYGLGGVRDLNRTATDLIVRLDATGEQISKLLQIGPSIDYATLVQTTGALRSSIERLIQDIDWEYGRTDQGRQLITEGQRIQLQAAHLADTAFQQDNHEHLVQDLRLFQQSWTPFLEQLRELRNRYIDRNVQQIAQIEREVSAALWIEQTLDRQQLLYLADNLTRDVDQFFDNAPLKMLMRLEEADQALATADAFYGMFENFIDCVNMGENQAELQDAFSYIESEWENFSRVYRPLNSSEAQQVLSAIEKDVTTLRQALLIQEGFDRRQAGELAAKIENLAGYLERDTRTWLAKARPAYPYAADAQREVTNFRYAARELQEALVQNANLRETRQMCDALFENWRRVYNHIVKCQSIERASLAATSSQTTPALVEMRTLLAL